MRIKYLYPLFLLLFSGFFAAYVGYITYKSEGVDFKTNASEIETTIYENSLASGWVSWSWNSVINFSSVEVSREHPTIKFTPDAYGGLYIHTDKPLAVDSDSRIEFSVYATQPNTKFVLRVYDQNNTVFPTSYNLEECGGLPTQNSWKKYSIPLSSAINGPSMLSGIVLQETGNNPSQTSYIDDLKLYTQQQPQVTPPGVEYIVYGDNLASSWVNWSWDSTTFFSEDTNVYTGTKSMSFTPKKGWAGLYLHTETGINTDEYSALTFAAKATQEDENYAVVLFGDYNEILGKPLPLSQFSPLLTSTWTTYTIPLTEFDGQQTKIKGVGLFSLSPKIQSKVYLDAISLLPSESLQSMGLQLSPTISPYKGVTPSYTNNPQTISSYNPFSENNFYIHQESHARKTVEEWKTQGREHDSVQLEKIANSAWAQWAVSTQYLDEVKSYIQKATEANGVPVIVSYNIPGRDCGLYSQGGGTYEGYKSWIDQLNDIVGERKVVIILEPDVLGLECLQNNNTYALLRYAIDTFSEKQGISVYVDAASWVEPNTMVQRLQSIGIEKIRGFALNTSGYNTTESMISYGKTVSSKLGGKHFIIDTSRNGKGPLDGNDPEPWCNPPGRALGERPTANTGNTFVDAFMWIKMPGESDGTCRSYPPAGTWVPDYALGLSQRAAY